MVYKPDAWTGEAQRQLAMMIPNNILKVEMESRGFIVKTTKITQDTAPVPALQPIPHHHKHTDDCHSTVCPGCGCCEYCHECGCEGSKKCEEQGCLCADD